MSLFKKIVKDSFIHNFGIILSGNLINQIILVLSYPIISRLYSPEQMGLFAQLQAVFNVLILIGTLKYERAIIITKNDEEEKHVISLCFYILIITSLLTVLIFNLFPSKVSSIIGNEKIKPWLFLLPVFTFLGGLQLIFINITTKRKQFKVSNYSNISLSSLNSLFKLIFGFLKLSNVGLFISRLLSFAISNFVFFFHKTDLHILLPTKENLKKIKRIAVKYKDFPLFLNSGTFINIFSISTLSLLISRYWGIKTLGFFSMANATLNLPITMIRNTFQTVYYQRASEFISNRKKLLTDFTKITFTLFFVVIIPIVILYFWGENIYSLLLGDKWQTTGKIAGYIFPWLAATLVASPATVIVPVLNLQKYFLILQITIFVTRIGLLVILHYLGKDSITVFKFLSVHGIIINIFNLSYVRNKLRPI